MGRRLDEVIAALPKDRRARVDAWFRAKVAEALADTRPDVAQADVASEFSARRKATWEADGGRPRRPWARRP